MMIHANKNGRAVAGDREQARRRRRGGGGGGGGRVKVETVNVWVR